MLCCAAHGLSASKQASRTHTHTHASAAFEHCNMCVLPLPPHSSPAPSSILHISRHACLLACQTRPSNNHTRPLQNDPGGGGAWEEKRGRGEEAIASPVIFTAYLWHNNMACPPVRTLHAHVCLFGPVFEHPCRRLPTVLNPPLPLSPPPSPCLVTLLTRTYVPYVCMHVCVSVCSRT